MLQMPTPKPNSGSKVRDFKTFEEKDRRDSKILGYINYGSKK